MFRRHKKHISTTVTAFFIIILFAPIFELIKIINSRIGFSKVFSKYYFYYLRVYAPSNVSAQNILSRFVFMTRAVRTLQQVLKKFNFEIYIADRKATTCI